MEPDTRADGSLSFDTACYPSLAEAADGTVVRCLVAAGRRHKHGTGRTIESRLARRSSPPTEAAPSSSPSATR